MENRTWKLASGLFLGLFALGLHGCQLSGGEKSSEAVDVVDEPIEISAEKLEPQKTKTLETPKSTQIVATSPLTVPTDPAARVKAVRKGRSNPFEQLVDPTPPASPTPAPSSSAQSEKNTAKAESGSKKVAVPSGSRSALNSKPTNSAATPKSNELPRLSNPASKAGTSDEIVLPPLPTPTLAKQVSVQGVMVLGGQPKAIVKAPNENVTRTVQAGDYLSNGQIRVASIDMSNPQNPQVILQEAGQNVAVGVGTPTTAAADGGSLSTALLF